MPPNPDLRLQAERINAFLQVLYRGPRRLSDTLQAGGLEAEAVQKLKLELTTSFYARLLFHWYGWIVAELSTRSAYILFRRYGLDGQPQARLATIGQELEISRERVRQLEVKILQRLRSPRCLRLLEQLACMAAREVLGSDQLLVIRPAAQSEEPEAEPAPSAKAVIPESVVPDLEAAVLALAQELPFKLPRSGIAKLLIGSAAFRVEHLRRHPLFGRFREYQRNSVMAVVDRLIAAGRLEVREKRVAAVLPKDPPDGASA